MCSCACVCVCVCVSVCIWRGCVFVCLCVCVLVHVLVCARRRVRCVRLLVRGYTLWPLGCVMLYMHDWLPCSGCLVFACLRLECGGLVCVCACVCVCVNLGGVGLNGPDNSESWAENSAECQKETKHRDPTMRRFVKRLGMVRNCNLFKACLVVPRHVLMWNLACPSLGMAYSVREGVCVCVWCVCVCVCVCVRVVCVWCVCVCVVWCGVVWCGVVWCGVVWCGVVWCGVGWGGVGWGGVGWGGVGWGGVGWGGVGWGGVGWGGVGWGGVGWGGCVCVCACACAP